MRNREELLIVASHIMGSGCSVLDAVAMAQRLIIEVEKAIAAPESSAPVAPKKPEPLRCATNRCCGTATYKITGQNNQVSQICPKCLSDIRGLGIEVNAEWL